MPPSSITNRCSHRVFSVVHLVCNRSGVRRVQHDHTGRRQLHFFHFGGTCVQTHPQRSDHRWDIFFSCVALWKWGRLKRSSHVVWGWTRNLVLQLPTEPPLKCLPNQSIPPQQSLVLLLEIFTLCPKYPPFAVAEQWAAWAYVTKHVGTLWNKVFFFSNFHRTGINAGKTSLTDFCFVQHRPCFQKIGHQRIRFHAGLGISFRDFVWKSKPKNVFPQPGNHAWTLEVSKMCTFLTLTAIDISVHFFRNRQYSAHRLDRVPAGLHSKWQFVPSVLCSLCSVGNMWRNLANSM